MRDLLKDTNKSVLQYLTDPANRVASIAILLVMVINIVQAVIRAAVYDFADLNFFLDPAIGMRFFNEDPFIVWPGNSYPAFFYAVMSLLTPFDRWFSSLLWAVLNVAFYIWIIAILNELIRLTQPGRDKWSYFIAPLLTLILFAINIHLGQSNILMLLAVIIGAYYLFHGKDLLSGVWMGFAIAYKVTPLFFMFYFILKRKFKAAFYALLFFGIFSVLAPMLFYSPSKSISFADSWSKMVLEPFFKGEKVKSQNVGYYHGNQSLDAFLNRHFTPYGEDEYGGIHAWLNPSYFSESQVYTIGKVIKLIIVALLGFLAIKSRSVNNRVYPFEISLFLMATLFISPVSWINHYILVLPAYVLAINELLVLKKSQSGRFLLLWSMVIGTVIMHLGWGNYLQSLSPFFVGQFIFFIGFYIYSLRYAAIAHEVGD
jgi:glycosyl transferase family 87